MNTTSRKIITALALGASIAITQTLHAEDPAKPADCAGKTCSAGGRAGHRLEKLTDTLNLTEEQKAQIKPITEAARAEAKATRENNALTPAEKRAKLKDIRQAAMGHIRSLLTAEQQQKLQELRAQRHHEGGAQKS